MLLQCLSAAAYHSWPCIGSWQSFLRSRLPTCILHHPPRAFTPCPAIDITQSHISLIPYIWPAMSISPTHGRNATSFDLSETCLCSTGHSPSKQLEQLSVRKPRRTHICIPSGTNIRCAARANISQWLGKSMGIQFI